MMALIAKLLAKPAVANWLIRRAARTPYTHIEKNGDVYMERYWLFNPYPVDSSGKGNWFPISIRLHHIRRPDQDRHLHDHPWNARTFILRGWYREVKPLADCQPDYKVARSAGETATLKFGEYHAITEISEGGVWTLFVTGKYRGTWGFLVDGAKVQWRTYLGIDQDPAARELDLAATLRERERFEAHMRAEGVANFTRRPSGRYDNMVLEWHWLGWRGRARAGAAS